MKRQQIIALGGGGFSMEPDNPLLDEYFLKQTGKRSPSVCLLPTASGDAEGYIVKFYAAFNKRRRKPTHLSLFRPPRDLQDFGLSQDSIYVGGGNTRNLLALWREWNLDKILRKAWRQGVLLGGVSAGAICWFEQGLTASIPENVGSELSFFGSNVRSGLRDSTEQRLVPSSPLPRLAGKRTQPSVRQLPKELASFPEPGPITRLRSPTPLPSHFIVF